MTTSAHFRTLSQLSPLLAVLFSPFSTLFDIPALFQPWIERDGVQGDPVGCLILSSVGLAFNVIANVLLLLRLTTPAKYGTLKTGRILRAGLLMHNHSNGIINVCLLCWFIKVVLATTNIAYYGFTYPAHHSESYTFLQGFFSAVVSLIAAFLTLVFLAFNKLYNLRNPNLRTSKMSSPTTGVDISEDHSDHAQADDEDSVNDEAIIRTDARRFLLALMSLVVLLAIEALIYGQIEGWAFTDALYFVTVTMLTCGFGDFVPQTTAGKVLTIPASILTIAQLANLLGGLFEFFAARAELRKQRWRVKFERKMVDDRTRMDKQDVTDLLQEVKFLEQIDSSELVHSQMIDLATSSVAFFLFWLLGALLFAHLEGWSYGIGAWFCYVSFITIGYGDYSPKSPAGRVVFIVYMIVAVPTVAAFAVQTITRTLEQMSEFNMMRSIFLIGAHKIKHKKHDAEFLPSSEFLNKTGAKSTNSVGEQHSHHHMISHSFFVDKSERKWLREQRKQQAIKDLSSTTPVKDAEASTDLERQLASLSQHVLDLAIEMESLARKLLIGHMSHDSRARNLLRADEIVQVGIFRVSMPGRIPDFKYQIRDVHSVLSEDKKEEMKAEVVEKTSSAGSITEAETMRHVNDYRESFARLLVLGSKLKGLEGTSAAVFERRRMREELIELVEEEESAEASNRIARDSDLFSFGNQLHKTSFIFTSMSAQTSRQKFEAVFPPLVAELTAYLEQCGMPSEAVSWFEANLQYNTPGGKLNRGLSVVDTCTILAGQELSEEKYNQAAILGWCIELLQAFFLVADDIMDASKTRRGQPCWYQVPKVGTIAINDSFMLEAAIYFLLKKYFRQESCYIDLIELFHDVTFQTTIGQLIDLTTADEHIVDLSKFSLEKHSKIVIYKTAYYSFYLPVALAMYLSGVATPENLSQADSILIPLGEYFQVQDDFLDVFAPPEVLGKIGTDIQDNKCSWVICTALMRAHINQRKVLDEHYGRKSAESEIICREVFVELDIRSEFEKFESTSHKLISGLIEEIDEKSTGMKKEVYTAFLNKIYKRRM